MECNFVPIQSFKTSIKLPWFEDGIYDFEVKEVEKTICKHTGVDLIFVKLKLFYIEGDVRNTTILLDWLYLNGNFAYRWCNFCKSVGRYQEYKTGKVNLVKLIGLLGQVAVYVKTKDGKTRNMADGYKF